MTDNFAHRAADWDQPSKIEMTEIFIRELKKNIELQKDWKGLEIGAGTGLVGLKLLPEMDSVVFEDTSAAMLGVLKNKLKGGEKVEIVEGEIFAYGKQDIDLAFSVMAFHHIPEMEKALKHLSAIIKPGGKVVVGDLVTEDGSFHSFEPIPHKGFDTNVLSSQFEAVGFRVLKSYVYNVLKRERIAGVISEYEQFILIAEKVS
jgi:ubiquinone/menaquinone biosynthesis C-methylase UbiE